MKTIVWLLVIVIIGAGGWYWWSMQDATTTPEGAAGTGSEEQGADGANNGMQLPMEDGAEGAIIGNNLALGTDSDTKVGKYLIAYNGMAVYTKDGDTTTMSSCYSTCATNWPPYLVGAEDNVNNVKAGVGGKVATIIRTDGSIQVTYNGKPLYFYATDKTSADVSGDGAGGIWHVAKP